LLSGRAKAKNRRKYLLVAENLGKQLKVAIFVLYKTARPF
jgi:hypothetical protein